MKKINLGIDVGGSNIRIVTKKGLNNQENNMFPFIHCESVIEEVEKNIVRPVNEYSVLNKGKNAGNIGLSLAAFFDRDRGYVLDWPNNKKWKGFQLKKYITERTGCNIFMEDDANCGALGEYYAGDAKGSSDFIYVTISTGIGSGIILNHKLYKGFKGMAGNLGHISLEEAEVLCSCGHKGCLQAVSSGRGMIQTFKERNSISAETVEDIVLLAEKGCVPAKNILENSVKSLAKVLTDTIKILDIPLIIIGGGVVHAYPLLGNELETRINFLLRSYNQQVAVKVSVLGDYNCAIGALYLNE